jgi:hypothetical protein
MTQPVAPEEVIARRKERAEEYGAWVATGPIDMSYLGTGADDQPVWAVGFGGRAFNLGDPVPKSTVERMKLDALGLVAKRGTAAADTVAAARSPLVMEDSVAAAIEEQQAAVEAAEKPRSARRQQGGNE